MLFTVRQVPRLISDSVTVKGWFFRGTSPWVGLQRLEASDETIKGFIFFPLGSYAGAAFVMALGIVLLVLRSFL